MSLTLSQFMYLDDLFFLSGRGFQQKAGAESSVGEYLLFLHSDTILPPNYDVSAEACLATPGNVAGSFLWTVDYNRCICLSV